MLFCHRPEWIKTRALDQRHMPLQRPCAKALDQRHMPVQSGRHGTNSRRQEWLEYQGERGNGTEVARGQAIQELGGHRFCSDWEGKGSKRKTIKEFKKRGKGVAWSGFPFLL